MKIAISHSGTPELFIAYEQWLDDSPPDKADFVDLAALSVADAVTELAGASGLLLGRGSRIDSARVERDMALVQSARERKLPVLACGAGALALHAALGGAAEGLGAAVRTDTSMRTIALAPGSLVKKVCRCFEGQAINTDMVHLAEFGRGLVASATASTGETEAFEAAEAEEFAFVLGVRWNPEELAAGNPLRTALAEHFLFECRSHHVLFSM